MMKKIKEDIIWLGMTGFGPQSNEAAYDPVLQARGGLMELTGEKEEALRSWEFHFRIWGRVNMAMVF